MTKKERMQKELNELKKLIKIKTSGCMFNFLKKFLAIFNKNVGAIALFKTYFDFRASKRSLIGQLQTFEHEGTHLEQQNDDKLFYLKYAFPQILAVFSLLAFLAFFNLWFLLSLIFLIFLYPFNAPYRARVELEAYKRQNEILIKYGYSPLPYSFIKKVFTGPTYFYMWKNFSKKDYNEHFTIEYDDEK